MEYSVMKHYIQPCATCHQLNHGVDASIGPDLNLPFNLTEYCQPDYLRQYIRDPASIRSWPQMRMPGFSQSAMDDAQLDELLAYLRHMRTRKIEKTKTAADLIPNTAAKQGHQEEPTEKKKEESKKKIERKKNKEKRKKGKK